MIEPSSSNSTPSAKFESPIKAPLPPFSCNYSEILCQTCWNLVEDAILTVLESKGHGNCVARVEEARVDFKRRSHEAHSKSPNCKPSIDPFHFTEGSDSGKISSEKGLLGSDRKISGQVKAPHRQENQHSSYESASTQRSNQLSGKEHSTADHSPRKILVDFSQQTDSTSPEEENPDSSSRWNSKSSSSKRLDFAGLQPTSWVAPSAINQRTSIEDEESEDENRIQTVDSEALSRALTSRWSVSTGDLNFTLSSSETAGSVDSDESGMERESTFSDREFSPFSPSNQSSKTVERKNDEKRSSLKNSSLTLRGLSQNRSVVSPFSSVSSPSRDCQSLEASTIGIVVSPMESVAGLKGSDSIYSSPKSFPNQTLTSKFPTSPISQLKPNFNLPNTADYFNMERRESVTSITMSELSHLTSPGEYGRNAISSWRDPDFENRNGIDLDSRNGIDLQKVPVQIFRSSTYLSENSTISDSSSSNETEIRSQESHSHSRSGSLLSFSSSVELDHSRENPQDIDDEDSSSELLEVEFEPVSEFDSDLETSNPNLRNFNHQVVNQITPTSFPFHQESSPISPFQLEFPPSSSPTASESQSLRGSGRWNIPIPSSPHLPYLDLFPSPTSSNFDRSTSNSTFPKSKSRREEVPNFSLSEQSSDQKRRNDLLKQLEVNLHPASDVVRGLSQNPRKNTDSDFAQSKVASSLHSSKSDTNARVSSLGLSLSGFL